MKNSMQILENALSAYISDIYENQSSRLVTFAQEYNYLNGAISIYKIDSGGESAIIEEMLNGLKSYFEWDFSVSTTRLIKEPNACGDCHLVITFHMFEYDVTVFEWTITIDTKESIIDSFKDPIIN